MTGENEVRIKQHSIGMDAAQATIGHGEVRVSGDEVTAATHVLKRNAQGCYWEAADAIFPFAQ